MGFKKIVIDPTSINVKTVVDSLDSTGYFEILDVTYSDIAGNVLYLYDTDGDERYRYTSKSEVVTQHLIKNYVIKGPVSYKDTDAAGGNKVILHVRDRI